MEKAYAQALWKIVDGGTAVDAAVASLRAHLERHGRIALLPAISRAFARIAAAHERRSRIVLSVSRHADESIARKECADVLHKLNAKNHDVEVCVDDTLIGGWRLEGRELLVDASYKKHLLSLYSKATSS